MTETNAFMSALLDIADAIDYGTKMPRFEDEQLNRVALGIARVYAIREIREGHALPPLQLAEVDESQLSV